MLFLVWLFDKGLQHLQQVKKHVTSIVLELGNLKKVNMCDCIRGEVNVNALVFVIE